MDNKKVILAIENFKKQMHKGVSKALKESADIIYKESQRLVPLDTSALRESGRVTVENEKKVHIHYGGGGAVTEGVPVREYAVTVHENHNLRHGSFLPFDYIGNDRTGPGSPPEQSGYLSFAWMHTDLQIRQTTEQIIKNEIKRGLK